MPSSSSRVHRGADILPAYSCRQDACTTGRVTRRAKTAQGFVALVTFVILLSGEPSYAADGKTGGLIRWEKVMIADNWNEGIAVCDVNNDGRLDLTGGPWWFEAPTWKHHPLRTIGIGNIEFFTNNGEHSIDLNGDGWVDLISASWFSDKTYWYENPGRAGLAARDKWKERLVIDGFGSCEGTLLEDLNGDGVPELIPNSWDSGRAGIFVRIIPGKDGGEPKFQKIELGGSGYGHGCGVGDINGDGRKDIMVNKGWYEAPAGDIFTEKWTFHKDWDFEHTAVPNLVVDVNGDGRNDLIVGHAHDYGLTWYEQGPARDGKTTWTAHEIDRSFSQVHCLVWADLDGDGRNELITGKRYRAHGDGDPGARDPVCLFRFVWDAAAGRFDKDIISFNDGVGTGMQIRVVDIDGDKRPDIAVAGKSGTYILYNRGPSKAGK